MKDTYSSNFEDPILANERLRNKIDYLERESAKRQHHLKDIQKTLKLNKQSIKLLNKEGTNNQVIQQLTEQNMILHQKLKEQYDNICRLNALYLMQCQLRIQDSKYYNERITEFEVSMSELRRYLHDKQESFSCVVEKLKKYEQINQSHLWDKVKNYTKPLIEDQTKNIIMKLTSDKDYYKQNYQKMVVLNEGIKNFPNIQQFKDYVASLQTQSIEKIAQKSQVQAKNSTKASNLSNISDLKNKQQPNIEIIRLMKKQKLNNQVLEAALNEAIQKNIELCNINRKLHLSLDTLRQQNDQVIADMVLLCEKMKTYDYNYRVKLRLTKHRSKCDIDTPSYKDILTKYAKNNVQEARSIIFGRMKEQVNEMGQIIAFCNIQKPNKGYKSLQSPRKAYIVDDSQDQQIDDNEQFSISEI